MPARAHRITQGEEYRRVFRQGRRAGGTLVVTHAIVGGGTQPLRFGYVVSKKVGNAVIRNRVRRRLKGVSREMLHAGYRGADIVFRATPASPRASYAELRTEISQHLTRLLPSPDAEIQGG